MRLTLEDSSDHPGVPREKRLDMKVDEERSPGVPGSPRDNYSVSLERGASSVVLISMLAGVFYSSERWCNIAQNGWRSEERPVFLCASAIAWVWCADGLVFEEPSCLSAAPSAGGWPPPAPAAYLPRSSARRSRRRARVGP